MPPPADFEILRAHDARRCAGGESKEELLRRASAERTTRANERRRKHAVLTIQRMWRGVTSRARSRAATLAKWDERYGSARTSPTPAELFDALLPPLRSVGAARAGATSTLRALALALGTSDLCAPETRANVRDWTVKTRRLAEFALDALAANVDTAPAGVADDADCSGDKDPEPAVDGSGLVRPERAMNAREQRRATRECAARLLALVMTRADDGAPARVSAVSLKTENVSLKTNAGAADTSSYEEVSASISAAVAYHARLCDVAASLIRARDACARTLVRLAVDGVVETRGVLFYFFGDSEASFAETNDGKRFFTKNGGDESFAREGAFFSKRAERNVAVRFFGAADTALHAIATPAWFASVVEEDDEGRENSRETLRKTSRFRLESFLAVFRDERASRNAPDTVSSRASRLSRRPEGSGVELERESNQKRFDPVSAANNLVWFISGWHPAMRREVRSAKAARARLAALPRSTARAFVETLDTLLESRDGDASFPGAPHRRVPALREAWFVAGVARDGDDGSLDALARLYWRAARDPDESSSALLDGSSENDKSATTFKHTNAVLSTRRRLLGALAFAPGTVRALWLRCASRVPAAVSISAAGTSPSAGGTKNKPSKHEEDPGAGGPGLWTSPALALGAASVAAENIPVLGVFALAYAHLLEVLDDDEFFTAQTPFSLSEQRAVAAAANTLVARERLRRVPSCDHLASSASHDLALDRRGVAAACASLLRALVTRDERRSFAPEGMWLAPASEEALRRDVRSSREIAPPLPPAAAASALLGMSSEVSFEESVTARRADRGFAAFLRDCPHALAFETRREIFRALVVADRARLGIGAQAGGVDADRATQGQRVRPVARLHIRRDRLLEDTLSGFAPLGSLAKGRVAVTFVNAAGQEEAGIDAGGLFKELLASALAELVDPRRGLFRETNELDEAHSTSFRDARASVFPEARAGDDPESAALLELAGLLMGKALYEGVLHEFRLAPFVAKKVLRQPLSLDDLPTLDATLHRSLKHVLRYEGDVSDLCLDWYAREDAYGQIVARALRPGEVTPEDVVESHDATAWAHATAEFHLKRRRAGADGAFERGLFTIVRPSWLRLFGANELVSLMTGDADGDVDVDDLRRHCAFGGGYARDSKTVRMFWACLTQFTKDERKTLLRFVTSSASPPFGGFKHLHPPFTLHKVRCDVNVGIVGGALASLGLAKDVERLPTASTCFNILKMPNFRRLETMKAKLRTAMHAGAGFELS